MKKLINNKFFIIGSIISLLGILFFFSSTQWNYCIETRLCGFNAIEYYYRPFYYASLSLMTFFIFFLFLSSRYFKQWLIWIFSWGFITCYILVTVNLQPGGGIFEPSADRLIVMQAVIFWIITLLFCIFLWWRGQRPSRR